MITLEGPQRTLRGQYKWRVTDDAHVGYYAFIYTWSRETAKAMEFATERYPLLGWIPEPLKPCSLVCTEHKRHCSMNEHPRHCCMWDDECKMMAEQEFLRMYK